MEKKAVVTLANWSSEYDFNGKHFFVHAISFDNGDAGEYHSMTQQQSKFVIGQEADYNFEVTDRGNRVKVVSTYQGGGSSNGKEEPGKQKSIERQQALKFALESYDIEKNGLNTIFTLADKFVEYLAGIWNDAPVQTPQQPTEIDTTKAVESNQMPF